jgi:hypothetical protein
LGSWLTRSGLGKIEVIVINACSTKMGITG